ncbi:murein biosynthesis integral membrane protein MurJ [Modestobacter muralis]|uniref:Lipid II flippase n=2 Tax=Modestobacter muralis TaxID=1608614 RepID=A0A6P0H7I4_9ACTN|nr:murein biosynthesis integral membrane protein MurJ [Modestobacter muralis]NEN50134.1 murein biosynthesis integral membrane protein MurJ [Modestobacter muralis]
MLTALAAVSGLLGFGRDAAIAAVFGVDSAVDAYLIAQGLMNLVLALVAAAAARALIPAVARSVAEGQPRRSDTLANTVLTVAVLVLVPAAVGMALAAQTVIDVLAPGFPPEVGAEAVRLTRIVLLATILVTGTDILAAVCQAHGRFFFSGLQGIPFNLVMIAATVTLGARWGADALAMGFVAGSALRLLVQLPAVRAAGVRLRPSLRVKHPDVAEVARLMPALLLGTALVNVNTLVDRAVGSGEAEGTIAALSFGWRLVSLPYTLLVISLVAALYPVMSAIAAPDRRAELRQTTERALGGVLAVLAPIVAILLVLTEPLVRVLLGRGEFDRRAVDMTATAISWFALGLVGVAIIEICSRVFYAVGDSRTPVALSVLGMVVNVSGDLVLGRTFGVAGLAAATTASFLLVAGAQLVALRARHNAVRLTALRERMGRCTLAGLVSGGAAWLIAAAMPSSSGAVPADLAVVTLAATGCLVCYVGALACLGGPELAELRRIIPRRQRL